MPIVATKVPQSETLKDSPTHAGNVQQATQETVERHGFKIRLENRKNTIRSGTSSDGTQWQVKMPADYGFIQRTEGADGDGIDVYLGENADSEHAFIINQHKIETNKFDEHKCMLGFNTLAEASKTYCAGFSDGKGHKRLGSIHHLPLQEFREWVKTEDTTTPYEPASETLVSESQESRYQIYCDMDGVIVDFMKGMKEILPGYQNWDQAIAQFGSDGVWDAIRKGGSKWWADLEWMPDGRQLWDFIKTKKPTILTAAATSLVGQNGRKGKEEWCSKHIGPSIKVIICDRGHDKQHFASPTGILIDDLEDNILQWRAKGGIGIHFKTASQAIRDLKTHLDPINEDWKGAVASGLLGLSLLSNPTSADAKHVSKPKLVKRISPMDANVTPEQLIKSYENSMSNPKGGYDKAEGKWFPHASLEGGSDTIGYGHKIQAGEDFEDGLTDAQAVALLRQDIAKREVAIKGALPKYSTYPQYLKNAILSAWFRGDLGPKATPKTMKLMQAGNWTQASKEYLNSADYRSALPGVKLRMSNNAAAFLKYGSTPA